MYQEKFMQLAIETARKGIEAGCGGPFGCVIVRGNEVLAATHNTVVRDNDPTAHGEVNAIRQVCAKIGNFNLEGCELYTTSEPCPMCLGAILWARIAKVYSAMNIDDARQIGFDDAPFYREVQNYANRVPAQLLAVEFYREPAAERLFADYQAMSKTAY